MTDTESTQAMARAIVQAHGGGVQVKSEVGKGTTFVVSLPAGAAR